MEEVKLPDGPPTRRQEEGRDGPSLLSGHEHSRNSRISELRGCLCSPPTGTFERRAR